MKRTKYVIALIVMLTLGFGIRLEISAQPGQGSQGKRPERGRPPQPPQEAIDACNGKSDGTTCEFTSPHGNAITGTCQTIQSQSACVPSNRPYTGQQGDPQTSKSAAPPQQQAQRSIEPNKTVPANTSTSALSYPIVDTGQAICYDNAAETTCPPTGQAFYGQDAQHEGRQPAYQDNGDGTITDLNTGLMWQQDPGEKMTYTEAANNVASFRLAGYSDWRLPTIKELYSLILFSGLDVGPQTTSTTGAPFIDTNAFVFNYGDTSAGERIIDAQYLSATKYVSTTMRGDETAFGVNFADGRIKGYGLTEPRSRNEKTFFVRYVRGKNDYGKNAFQDNGNGTISDNSTGLTWMQADSGKGMAWADALSYCENLEFAGQSDWRLPDVKELQSLVDYSRSPATTHSAAIAPLFQTTEITDEGGKTNYPFYWTSTTHANERGAGSAVYIAFGEALGWMKSPQGNQYTLMDVHGAGAQRSDPKTGDASDYPHGHGPQGDVIRVNNYVRCVR